MAAHQIINEGVDAAIGGGTESISMTPRNNDPNPWVRGTQASSLHGDGRYGGSGRQTL